MARGSYGAIYTHVKRELMLARERVLYFVLEALAMHADGYGVTFVGVQTLAQLTGYAPASVSSALDELQARNYVRVMVRYDDLRRRETRDIILNPDVFHVSDIAYENAVKAYEYCTFVMQYIQPNNNQTQYPTQEPNAYPTQNQTPPPTATTQGGATKLPPKKDVIKTEKAKTKTGAQRAPTSSAQSAQVLNSPPDSAPPPPLPPNGEANDEASEQIAQVVASHCNTRLRQARRVVQEYGHARVYNAYQWLRQEQRNGATVKNPFGLLVWWLRAGVVQDDDTIERAKDARDAYKIAEQREYWIKLDKEIGAEQ